MFTYRKQILVDNNLRRPLDIALAKDEACAKLNDNKLSFDCFAITRGRGMGQHTIGFSIEIAVPHKGQARFIRRHTPFLQAQGFQLLNDDQPWEMPPDEYGEPREIHRHRAGLITS